MLVKCSAAETFPQSCTGDSRQVPTPEPHPQPCVSLLEESPNCFQGSKLFSRLAFANSKLSFIKAQVWTRGMDLLGVRVVYTPTLTSVLPTDAALGEIRLDSKVSFHWWGSSGEQGGSGPSQNLVFLSSQMYSCWMQPPMRGELGTCQ